MARASGRAPPSLPSTAPLGEERRSAPRPPDAREIPARIFPVFRDEAELPVHADLSRPILRALHNSRYLAALCSPGAVASRFVADEITRFKAMGNSDRLIAAPSREDRSPRSPWSGPERRPARSTTPG